MLEMLTERMLGKTYGGYANLLRSDRLMMHSHQPLNHLWLPWTETASCSWQVAQLAVEQSGAICWQELWSSHQPASQWAQLDTQQSLGLTGARLKSGDKVRRRLTAALTKTTNPGARRLSSRLGQERRAAEREARKKLEVRQCTLLLFMFIKENRWQNASFLNILSVCLLLELYPTHCF